MIEIYNCPGIYMTDKEMSKLHHELLSVATQCLEAIPNYQCLSGKREEFSRLIIAVSRDKNNMINGFCSSYILDAGKLGSIFHLGLTCVSPSARGLGLTHTLTSKVIITYLFKYSLFRPAWISNVACVLSSLGNVAMHFEDVYPSPFTHSPKKQHTQIANFISDNFRRELYVNHDAGFYSQRFIFTRSVTGTMFAKSANDTSFYHRSSMLNNFYKGLIDFDNGDEVLQIGKVSLLTYPKYLLRSLKLKFNKLSKFSTHIITKPEENYSN